MINQQITVMHIASGDLWAGAEVQLATLARSQSTYPDVSVTVVLLNHGRLEQELLTAGIQVIVLDETKLNGFSILKSLIRIMKQRCPDIVHTHRTKENVLGSIAAKFSGVRHSVRTAHGAPEYSPSLRTPAKWVTHQLDIFCGRFLQQRIFAVSDDLADILARTYRASRIHVVENGIDIAPLQKVQRTTTDRLVHIGIVGRLAPVKRVDIFIQSAARVIQQQPAANTVFHIYGDGPLTTNLKQLAMQLGLQDAVIFEGHSENIHQDIKNLDMLLMTSDHEGLPMTLLEAMALGTPIIAHAVGGIPVLLDHGSCGVLVTDHQPSGYIEAILTLSGSTERRKEIAAAAKNRVTEHYSALKNASAYIENYQELITTPTR